MTNWQQQSYQLWGERWKSTLALTAGVHKRTVQRWNAKGQAPQWVVDGIIKTYNIWVKE